MSWYVCQTVSRNDEQLAMIFRLREMVADKDCKIYYTAANYYILYLSTQILCFNSLHRIQGTEGSSFSSLPTLNQPNKQNQKWTDMIFVAFSTTEAFRLTKLHRYLRLHTLHPPFEGFFFKLYPSEDILLFSTQDFNLFWCQKAFFLQMASFDIILPHKAFIQVFAACVVVRFFKLGGILLIFFQCVQSLRILQPQKDYRLAL